MSEAELQDAIVTCARLLGWRVFHARPARRQSGKWSTPVAYDGAGFFDLVLARRGRVILAEIKAEKGRLSPEQQAWREAVRVPLTGEAPTLDEGSYTHAAGVSCFIWRPSRWLDGTIERVLR